MTDLNVFFKLNATGGEQDWDIELADASRVEEFIENYHHPSFDRSTRGSLLKLIIASYNDLIDEAHDQWDRKEREEKRIWSKITDLIREEPELHREIIEY